MTTPISPRDVLVQIVAEMRKRARMRATAADTLLNEYADRIERALAVQGGEWVTVPREPTQEMMDAALNMNADLWATDVLDLYRAMLAAAPPAARQDSE